MNNKIFGVAVKAVVKNKDNKYLILKKSGVEDVNPNTYDLPGGRIEFGEKLEEAIIREVFEETGLNIIPKNVFNAWTFVKDNNFQLTGIDFLCELIGGQEKLSDEHEEIGWFSLDEIKRNAEIPSWLIKTIEKLPTE